MGRIPSLSSRLTEDLGQTLLERGEPNERQHLARCIVIRSRIWSFALATVALSLFSTASADAKGGHSGRGRGGVVSPAVQPTSKAVTGDPPAPRAVSAVTAPTVSTVTAPTVSTGTPAATTPGANIPVSSLNAAIALPTPAAAPVPTPASVITAPAQQVGVVAPLSPLAPVQTDLTTGGSSGVSLPGGGRQGLQACMEFWDRETHMTKAEWKVSCQRSIQRMDSVKVDSSMPEWLMRR
jgi:hypothetical protein